MAEIVNMRRARKERARAEKDAVAAQNRAAFGRTRAERQRAEAEAELDRRRIAAHRLTSGGTPTEGEA